MPHRSDRCWIRSQIRLLRSRRMVRTMVIPCTASSPSGTLPTQKAEVAAGCTVINIMTGLGMPVSQRVT